MRQITTNRRREAFALDAPPWLFSMNTDFWRRGDSQLNVVTANVHDGDLDVIANHDCLIALSR